MNNTPQGRVEEKRAREKVKQVKQKREGGGREDGRRRAFIIDRRRRSESPVVRVYCSELGSAKAWISRKWSEQTDWSLHTSSRRAEIQVHVKRHASRFVI